VRDDSRHDDPISAISRELRPAALYELAGFFRSTASREPNYAKRRALERRARAFGIAARKALREGGAHA